MILYGNDGSGLRIAGPFATFAEFDLEGPEASKLDGLPGKDGALDFVEKGIDEAMYLFAVESPAGVEGFDELGLRDFTSHDPLLRALFPVLGNAWNDVALLPGAMH